MNYQISRQWTALSTILGESYDATKKYRIHNNVKLPAKLVLSEDETPNGQGRVYPQYCEIIVNVGKDVKLAVVESISTEGFDIEISEVA